MTSREVTIQVEHRESNGSANARRLRGAGKVPGVVYGGGVEPEAVQFDPRPVQLLLATELGMNSLIHLKIGDRELRRMVMIKEVQYHPVTGRLIHTDFARVDMDKKVIVSVPVRLVGVPVGVKSEAGHLDLVHRTIEIKVLPASIPEHLDVDVSELHVGQHVEAGEVTLPAGAELVTHKQQTIATVLGQLPELEEAAPAAEAAAPAEGAAAAPAAAPAEKPGK